VPGREGNPRRSPKLAGKPESGKSGMRARQNPYAKSHRGSRRTRPKATQMERSSKSNARARVSRAAPRPPHKERRDKKFADQI
jgi:hypothetical protein